MLDMLIISPCFYPDHTPAELMVASAKRNGLTVMLYGLGQQFIPHGADAQVSELYEWMGQKRADYALITDCRDVLFLAGEDEILNKFLTFGAPLVMSTERGCWPPDHLIVEHFYSTGYINAGQYIGTWEYVRHCLKHLLDNYRFKHPGPDNSQGWWMWAKMRKELDFSIDTESVIFQSMSQDAEHDLMVSGKRMVNVLTHEHPCSIHFNGNPGNDKPQRELYRRLFE
jgi:hypothetical protein